MKIKTSPTLGRPPTFEAPRETILSEASKLFAVQSYDNTTLQSGAAAVGITKAAIYHYYPTKQAMYDAIVVDLLARLDEYVHRHIETDAPHPVRLKQFMLAHADFFEKNYAAFVTLLQGMGGLSRPTSSDEVKVRDRYERLIRQIVEGGTRNQEFKNNSYDTTTRAVLSLLNWMSRWYRPSGPKRAREFAEEYFDIIFEGLKPR